MRLATYNLLNPVFEEKYSGHNTWKERLPFIVETILASESDMICVEEVGKKQYVDLLNSDIHKSYLSFYVSHAPSQLGQPEGRDGLAFFYKPEKVALLKLVQSKDGSRPTHRRDFYVDLTTTNSAGHQIYFRVGCTHLDADKDLSVGNRQLKALVEAMQHADHPENLDFMVVCGDFNEGEDEAIRPRFETMQKAGFYTDGSTEPTRPENLNVRHKGHIDWIYFKKLSALELTLIPVKPIGDEKASDHKLTMTDIHF